MPASGTLSRRIIRGLFRTIAAIVLIVLLGVCVLYLLLQAGKLNPLMKSIAVRTVNRSINGELSIASIYGNPLKNLEIRDIRLRMDGEMIASIGSISLKYDLSGVLKKEFNIKQIRIDSLWAYAAQSPDSTWNFSRLAKTSEATADEEDQAFSLPDNKAELGMFEISSANIDIDALDPKIPSRIENLHLKFGAKLNKEGIYAQLIDFGTRIDSLNIKRFGFIAIWSQSVLNVAQFEFETDRTRITAQGTYGSDNDRVRLQLNPLDLRDFERFLPEFQHPDQIFVNLNATANGDSLNANATIRSGADSLSLNAKADSYINPTYFSLEMSMQKVNLADDWGIPFYANDLELIVSGSEGITKESGIHATVSGKRLQYDKYPLERLGVEADYSPEEVEFNINAENDERNSVFLSGNLELEKPDRPFDFRGNLSFHSSDYPQYGISTNLSTTLSLSGSGLLRDGANLKSDISLDFKPTTIEDFEILSGTVKLTYDGGAYELKAFRFDAASGDVKGSGKGNINGEQRIDFSVGLSDLSQFETLSGMDKLEGVIRADVSARGKLDSLQFQFSAMGDNLDANELSVEALRIEVTGNIQGNDVSAEGEFGIDHAAYGDVRVDSLRLDAGYLDNALSAKMNLYQSEERYGRIDIRFRTGETNTLEIPLLDFHLGEDHWTLAHDTTQVCFSGDCYSVNDFTLQAPPQAISASGVYVVDGDMDAQLTIDSLNLAVLNDFLPEDSNAGGVLNLHALVQGRMTDPRARLVLSLSDLSWGGYDITGIEADLTSEDRIAKMNAAVRFTPKESFSLDANVPLGLIIRVIPIAEDSLAYVHLLSDSIDIGFVNDFTSEIQLDRGYLVMDISLTSDLVRHDVGGRIKMTGKSLTIRQLGTRYDDLLFELTGDNESIRLDTLYAEGGDGTLSASGYAMLGDFVNDYIRSIDFRLLARKFQFSKKRQLRLVSDMDIKFTGTMDDPRFDADVNIIESRVNIDQFTGGSGPPLPSQKPLLVAALTDTTEIVYEKVTPEINLSKNLSGVAHVTIPRNTWVYGKDMQVELTGDIKALKEGQNLYLTGQVRTVRGDYNLYGRKFRISSASVTFTGGRDIDPILDVKADYIFRDLQQNQRTLRVILTGRINDPKATFTLDGAEIEQADAVSYILFKRSASQLTQNEKSSMNENTSSASFAQGLIIKELSSQLTSSIREQLDLDVLEIQGNEDISKTSVVVGKYITNRLFLSYERRINPSSTNDAETEIMTLEYQINKAFSIQGTRGNDSSTGVDLIWKYEN